MQEPLYSFLSAPFVHTSVGEADSPVRLQAHIRACMALSRLSSCVPVLWAEGSESPLSRADRLWEFAMGKCGVSAFSLADRFRLCDALYALCRETALVPVSGREDLCEGLLSSLLEDRALTGQPVAGDEDTVCACCRALQSALFPWVEEDDSWFRSLCATLSGWCAEQATDGSWSGISAVQAWHRLSVLNRHSWLFRDHSFDAAVRRLPVLRHGILPCPGNSRHSLRLPGSPVGRPSPFLRCGRGGAGLGYASRRSP